MFMFHTHTSHPGTTSHLICTQIIRAPSLQFKLHSCLSIALPSPLQPHAVRRSMQMPRAPSPWRYCANPLRFFPSGAPCFSPQLLLLMYFIPSGFVPSGFVPSGTPCSLVQVLGAHTHPRRCYHLCSGSQAENLHVHILAPCSPCSGILCSPLLSNSILTLLRYPMLT